MASSLLNYPYGGNGGYGGGRHQYAYNLGDQTVQRVPSGVFFDLSRIDAGREELETLEKGIDPFHVFPTFHNLDCGYVSNSSDGASTPSTGSETRCLPLLDVNIDVDVQSSIAKTKVMQTFTNLSNYAIKETNYSFPLYDGSAVVSFRCHVGEGKLLEGAIKPKEVAKKDFKEAVAKQKVAALLEEHTPEVFETKLGNIPARTSVKVEITYVNELKAEIGGEGVLVTLPTSIAPRYGAPPPQMSASSATGKNGLHIIVHVHALESLRKLESRTHPISVEMGTAGTAGIPTAVSSFGDLAGAAAKVDSNEFDPKKAKATLSERQATLGRDFLLMILAAGSSMLASGAQLEEAPRAEAQSAMKLTINPRDLFSSYVEPECFNGEIIFIADRSGSMQGPKMNTLKDALNVSLKSLTEKVRFNIYSFGSSFISLWPQSQLYTDDNVELALRNVSTFTADMGATEILRPIKEAVQKRIIKSNFTTQIICLTDGEAWDEAAVRKFVRDTRSKLKGAVRFFALGIGNAVSHRLVEGIGTEGGGFAEVVAVDSRERWEGRVARMLKGAFMPESYDCELEFDGMSTKAACSSTEGSSFMQAPYKLPALHPFSRMTVYFLFDKKYGADLNVISLKTSTPSGEQISVEVLVSKTTASTYIVHHLAAKAIVMDLETGKSWLHSTINNSKAADTAAKELGERLAINYHITSKWTSFVAVEKKRNEQNAGRLYKAPKGDLAMLKEPRTAPIVQLQQASGPVDMSRNISLNHYHPSHSGLSSPLTTAHELLHPRLSAPPQHKFPTNVCFSPISRVSTSTTGEERNTERSNHLQAEGLDSTEADSSAGLEMITQALSNSTPIPQTSNATKTLPTEVQEANLSRLRNSSLPKWRSPELFSGSPRAISSSSMFASRSPLSSADGKSKSNSENTSGPMWATQAEPSSTRKDKKKKRFSYLGRILGKKTEKCDESPQHAAAVGTMGSDATHFPSEITKSKLSETREQSASSMHPVSAPQTVTSSIGFMFPPQDSAGTSHGIVEVGDVAKTGFEDSAWGYDGRRGSEAHNQVQGVPKKRDSLLKLKLDELGRRPEKPTTVLESQGIQGTSARRRNTVIDYDDMSSIIAYDDDDMNYSSRRGASSSCDSLVAPPTPPLPRPRAPARSESYSALPPIATIAPPTPNAAIPTQAIGASHIRAAEAAPRPAYTWSKDSSGDNGSMALNLHNLIRVQSAEGSFKLPPYLLNALCSFFHAGIFSTLDNTLSRYGEGMKTKLGNLIELLQQTLLAVTWIKLACAKDKEIWELLVRKAERWVGRTVGDKRVEEMLCECVRARWVGPAGQG